MTKVLTDSQTKKLTAFRDKYGQNIAPDTLVMVMALAELLAGFTEPQDPADPQNGYAVTTATNETGAGSIEAGAFFVKIENSGAADAQVGPVGDSANLKAGASICYPVAYGLLLPEIFFDATGTQLTISTARPPIP